MKWFDRWKFLRRIRKEVQDPMSPMHGVQISTIHDEIIYDHVEKPEALDRIIELTREMLDVDGTTTFVNREIPFQFKME